MAFNFFFFFACQQGERKTNNNSSPDAGVRRQNQNGFVFQSSPGQLLTGDGGSLSYDRLRHDVCTSAAAVFNDRISQSVNLF